MIFGNIPDLLVAIGRYVQSEWIGASPSFSTKRDTGDIPVRASRGLFLRGAQSPQERAENPSRFLGIHPGCEMSVVAFELEIGGIDSTTAEFDHGSLFNL